jgi:nicotinamidase-related amidase
VDYLINNNIAIGKNAALVVVDMINDGCRKGGAFDLIDFDMSSFNKIEDNVRTLVDYFSHGDKEIVFVRSLYDAEYISKTMVEKFKVFGLDKIDFSKKGYWGSQLIDSLPDVYTAILFKSNYCSFSLGFSALFDRAAYLERESYFSLKAFEDIELKQKGKLTLKDYYKQSVLNDCFVIFEDQLNIPMTLHGYLKYKNIDTIVFVGGSTHVCLAATVYSAASRGYNIVLPVDAIASEDCILHDIYLRNFRAFNSFLTYSSDIINNLIVKGDE